VLALLAGVLASSAYAATPKPVPSLTPAATMKLWRQLAHRHRTLQAAKDCKPTRAIFYAPTDWLRLATTLAQNTSPCVQYYITVPPLTGDKTQPRPKQAALIHALGPNIHPVDEISFAGWSRWVAANNGDWFTAGVTARQRMVVAGYDVSLGDTWAMNETSTAVRKNTGSARTNLEEFLRGLDDGGGNPLKGIVFAIGQNQGGDQTAYKVTMQSWLQDSTFWTTVSSYVSDWMQETYGDLRTYAVAGTTPQQRRDELVQFLGHPLALANAGGDLSAAARAFLLSAYGPLGNAAWAWTSSYGWTSGTYDQMEDFVSAEAYAERTLDADSQLPADRLGFAWSPNNTLGVGGNDFTKQTQAILTRVAQAVRDSDESVDPSDPGIGACEPGGQLLWCQNAVIAGAAFTNQWAAFSSWTQTGIGFVAPAVSFTAGTTTGPINVQLKTGSVVTPATVDTPVTLTTTSTKGQFSTTPAGPWTSTLAVTIPSGSTSAAFYYQDTAAGTPTISAAIPNQPAATQVETVIAGVPAKLTAKPAALTITGGMKRLLTADVVDQYGNPSTAPVTWSLAPSVLGTVRPASGGSTTFTASQTAAGRGKITARVGALVDTIALNVMRPPAKIGGTLARHINGHEVVTVWVVRGKLRAKGVHVTFVVRRGSSIVARVSGRTDVHGRITWRSKHPVPAGRYVVKAAIR
jgi:hypothetical protein